MTLWFALAAVTLLALAAQHRAHRSARAKLVKVDAVCRLALVEMQADLDAERQHAATARAEADRLAQHAAGLEREFAITVADREASRTVTVYLTAELAAAQADRARFVERPRNAKGQYVAAAADAPA